MTKSKKASPRDREQTKRSHGGRPSLEAAEQISGRILDAAAELFSGHSYAEIGIEAIAAHAGVGKLTVYKRFGDKHGLFQAMAVRMSQQRREEVAAIGESEGSLEEVLIAMGRRVLDIVLSAQSVAFHRILLTESSRLPELSTRTYLDSATDLHAPFRAVFRRFIEQGVLRIDDVGFLERQFIQLVIGRPLLDALLGAPPMTPQAQEVHIRRTTDLFLRGGYLRADKEDQSGLT